MKKWFIKWIWFIIPVPFFVTDNMPDPFGAQAKCFFCTIRPKYRDDAGLIAHELVHIKWAYLCLIVPYVVLYRFCRWFRLKAEVAGYKTQLAYGANIDVLAYRLANVYNLNISVPEAKKLIEE